MKSLKITAIAQPGGHVMTIDETGHLTGYMAPYYNWWLNRAKLK